MCVGGAFHGVLHDFLDEESSCRGVWRAALDLFQDTQLLQETVLLSVLGGNAPHLEVSEWGRRNCDLAFPLLVSVAWHGNRGHVGVVSPGSSFRQQSWGPGRSASIAGVTVRIVLDVIIRSQVMNMCIYPFYLFWKSCPNKAGIMLCGEQGSPFCFVA